MKLAVWALIATGRYKLNAPSRIWTYISSVEYTHVDAIYEDDKVLHYDDGTDAWQIKEIEET